MKTFKEIDGPAGKLHQQTDAVHIIEAYWWLVGSWGINPHILPQHPKP